MKNYGSGCVRHSVIAELNFSNKGCLKGVVITVKKRIFKGCAIAFVVVLILIIVAVCTLPAIIKTVEQNKKNKSINDAEIVGNYILKGISNDTLNEDIKYYLDTDFSYRDDYTLLLADTDEVQEILDSKQFCMRMR